MQRLLEMVQEALRKCIILLNLETGLPDMNQSYFAGYEVTKKALTPAGASPSDLNFGAVIFAGGMAGVCMWSIAIPPDVRKLPPASRLRACD